MTTNKEKDKVQKKALDAFIAAGSTGCLVLETGTGKSKATLAFIRQQADVIRTMITSQRTNLKKNWYDEQDQRGI